jgi:hypothetical protein
LSSPHLLPGDDEIAEVVHPGVEAGMQRDGGAELFDDGRSGKSITGSEIVSPVQGCFDVLVVEADLTTAGSGTLDVTSASG